MQLVSNGINMFNQFSLTEKLITSFVVIPHGVTDILHATVFKNVQHVFNIYSASALLYTYVPSQHALDIVFYAASVGHFRHDFPTLFDIIPRYITSLLFIMTISKASFINFMLYYMSVIHVPQHYRRHFFYLKKHPWKIIFAIMYTAFVSFLVMDKNPASIILSSRITNIVKSIIVSHIMYEEIYVHKSFNKKHRNNYII